MKHTAITLAAIWLLIPVFGQHLGTGAADPVGLESWSYTPYLVESGPGTFFMISGSYLSTVTHPLLKEVYNDFANIFFIRYDRTGKAVSSNHIQGTSTATNAFSYGGGLTVVASAGDNVEASGNQLPLNGAGNIEFIARYDKNLKLEKIIRVWVLSASQYANSDAAMDNRDGSVYIYGNRTEPAEVAGYGMIGNQWAGRFLYVVKYSADLQLQWVYTAGFEQAQTGYGYYNQLRAHPDGRGGVVITGAYESGEKRPVFGNDTLQLIPDGMGLFAAGIDRDGNQSWSREGSMKGYGYGTTIHKGMPLENGDMVMAGVTTTGYFRLGDAEFSFENGAGYANQFVCRMGPDGNLRWSVPFRSMGKSESQEKKSSIQRPDGVKAPESDEFEEDLYYDAHLWRERILYLAGTYLNDSFQVAGQPLDKAYPEGLFIASLDVESGKTLWGYGLSSDWVGIHGFDADRSGNVTLMGYSGARQDYNGFGKDSVPGKDLVFHLGLDFDGNPLWYNNAYLQNSDYGLYGADLEVLAKGEVFSSMHSSRRDNIVVGDTLLGIDFTYSSWVVGFEPGTEIGGQAVDQPGAPLTSGYVRAFKASRSGSYPPVDSVYLDGTGGFRFEGLYPGSYTFQAVPGEGAPLLAIPTYLGDQVFWKDAQFIDVESDTRASFLEIQLAETPVRSPGEDNGTVSGNVSYEDQVIRKGTMGRPVKKASVILIKKTSKKSGSGDVVAYVETDDLGNFVFEDVPDGDYILIVNITGLEMIETHHVRIEGNVIVSGLDYTVGEEGIYTWGGVGIAGRDLKGTRVFPNPGNGLILLDLRGAGFHRIEVYSGDGRLVHRTASVQGPGIRSLDITGCDPGVYMIRIINREQNSVTRYVKR